MSEPTAEQIPQRDGRTASGEGPPSTGRPPGPVAWAEVEKALLAGGATSWLSVRAPRGVHTRPVLAAWTGASFVFASKSSAAKTAHLEVDGRASLAVELSHVHVVVEGVAERLTDAADLARASTAMLEVYDWPTTVVGDELDAPYAAPTAGGPPFRVYELTPMRAYAFPTADEVAPTRFTW